MSHYHPHHHPCPEATEVEAAAQECDHHAKRTQKCHVDASLQNVNCSNSPLTTDASGQDVVFDGRAIEGRYTIPLQMVSDERMDLSAGQEYPRKHISFQSRAEPSGAIEHQDDQHMKTVIQAT